MTATSRRSAGAPSGTSHRSGWDSISWKTAHRSVRRLQMRIAKAVREGRQGKVKALQWLLTHSHYARLVAVKRVVSNKGKRTPGVDKAVWSTSRQKMRAVKSLHRRGYRPSPLRRVYIPKKNGKKRALGIPSMRDRAMQALYSLALTPVAETTGDPNSYGFREGRSCADAIGQCFISLAKGYSPEWVLEGDIAACFDEISHEWMLQHILMDKQVLRKWLDAGFMEEGSFYPTRAGTPQGGIISPTLANMVLDGLEAAAKSAAPRRSKVNVIRYADDFVITGCTKELLEEKVKPAVVSFLKERGLSLSEEKTRITRIEDGFDFLGQNLCKYAGKLLIRPARNAIKSFLCRVREIIRRYWKGDAVPMIRELNSKIRGWANYHRHVVSSETFEYVEDCIRRSLWYWMRRKHQNKSVRWLMKKYMYSGTDRRAFSVVVTEDGQPQLHELIRVSSFKVKRHIKIRGAANPYDSQYEDYYRERKARRMRGRRAIRLDAITSP